MTLRRAVPALLALAALGALAAPPAAARDRSQTVAGWRIVYQGTGDGGRLVRLDRRGRGWRFAHHLEFWRGNGGIVIGASFRRGACRSGDADLIVPDEQALSRAAFDQRLADYLRECPLPRGEAAALRRSLDRAWPLFLAWARQARAATAAENEAIARHGEAR